MLVLKLVGYDMLAYGGFRWPESGPVECPNWDPAPECGGGLHGWARGEGGYIHGSNAGRWLVVAVVDADVIQLDGKCKFQRGTVVHCGTRATAVQYLIEHGVLTAQSDPAWVCLTPAQCAEVALRAADRAVRQYTPRRLRARGLVEAAERLEQLPEVVNRGAALAAAYAAYAAYAADAAYTASAAYAAYAADAAYAASAADNAAYAASARDAERELVRTDKLALLGIGVTRG